MHVNEIKHLDEHQTRRNLLHFAYNSGGNEKVQELLLMMKRHDDALGKCKNETELAHMRVLCVAEIYRFLGLEGSLAVNGIQVFDEKKL